MIEKGTTESGLEEVIGQGIAFGIVPEWQFVAVVIAHDQATRIGHFRESIIEPTIDLGLVLIELMD